MGAHNRGDAHICILSPSQSIKAPRPRLNLSPSALGPRPSALIFARTGTGDFVSRQALREKHVQERLQKFSQPGSLRSLGLGKDAKLRIGWTSCVYIWCRQEMTLDT